MFGREEVHNHRPEVEQHPSRVRLALPRAEIDAPRFHLAFERVDQRIELADVVSRGDNKVVRERGDLADVELDDILGLAIREDIDEVLGDLG